MFRNTSTGALDRMRLRKHLPVLAALAATLTVAVGAAHQPGATQAAGADTSATSNVAGAGDLLDRSVANASLSPAMRETARADQQATRLGKGNGKGSGKDKNAPTTTQAATTTTSTTATTIPAPTTTTQATTTTTQATTTTTQATTTTTQAATTTTQVPSTTPDSYEDVPTNVNVNEWLMPAWEPNLKVGYPAFRMFCEFSKLGFMDPIVAPGSSNFMHLHMFFGNTAVDPNSTYQSLRSTGNSTCDGGPLNRTAYWMPAVFDGQDQVVVPSKFELYYKAENAADPSQVRAKPNGLRMVAGAPDTRVFEWKCGGQSGKTIPDCGSGERLTVSVRFPYCWDGKNLDSPDHRSHMAYGIHNTWGPCPPSHPVHVAELTEFAHFDNVSDTADWHLSSDRMNPSSPAPDGSMMHADWFGAWDNDIQDRWVDNCLKARRSASNGNLCDGQQLLPTPDYTGPSRITGWTPTPR